MMAFVGNQSFLQNAVIAAAADVHLHLSTDISVRFVQHLKRAFALELLWQ